MEFQTSTYTHRADNCKKLSDEAVSKKLHLISIKKREMIDKIQKLIEERESEIESNEF